VIAPQREILRRPAIRRRNFPEERFYFSGRRKRYEQPARPAPRERPHVRNSTRSERRIAVPQRESPTPNLEDEFPLEDIEPLVLPRMEVAPRTSLAVKNVFGNEQASPGFGLAHFEADEVIANWTEFAETIRVTPHNVRLNARIAFHDRISFPGWGLSLENCHSGE
jgi:hypothetical protein